MSQLSVANIVAETMDNYLLLGHILRCKVLPSEEAHPDLWVGANRKYRAVPSVRLERARLEKPRTKDEQEKAERRLTKRQASKKAKLAELGIDYDLEPVSFVRPPPTHPLLLLPHASRLVTDCCLLLFDHDRSEGRPQSPGGLESCSPPPCAFPYTSVVLLDLHLMTTLYLCMTLSFCSPCGCQATFEVARAHLSLGNVAFP